MVIGLAHVAYLNTWLKYQRMQKDKKGKAPQGQSHHACLLEANMTLNIDNDDFLKIDLEDFGDNE